MWYKGGRALGFEEQTKNLDTIFCWLLLLQIALQQLLWSLTLRCATDARLAVGARAPIAARRHFSSTLSSWLCDSAALRTWIH
jgi:hypothetical protein